MAISGYLPALSPELPPPTLGSMLGGLQTWNFDELPLWRYTATSIKSSPVIVYYMYVQLALVDNVTENVGVTIQDTVPQSTVV